MFSTNDKLVQQSRGNVDEAYQYCLSRGANQKLDFLKAYLNELYRLCQKYTFDFGIAFGQFCDETACGKSAYWLNNGNPAGLAITGPGVVSMTWKTGQEAARGQIVHWYVYIHGAIPSGDELAQYIELDPHYNEALAAYGGTATTIQDFAGHWAENTNYANQIVAHANNAFANSSQEGVVMPNIIDKWLHVSQDGYAGVERRYIGRFGMAPKVIFLHIQEGNNWGSWQHFHEVTASATVLIGKNGDIWRLVPESDAPWTNGDVMSPTALGWEVINKWGADPNVYTLSIETEGFTNEWPKDQAQLDSVVWQIATWMKNYNIPLHYVLRHADVNMVTRPDCPGNAYYNYIIDRLSKGVDVQASSVYATPSPVMADGKAWDGSKDVTLNGVVFHAEKRTVKTNSNNVPCRVFATTTSAETRSTMNAGQGFSVIGWVNGEEVKGEARWWVTPRFSRIWVGNTDEKPGDKPAPVVDTKPDPAPEPGNDPSPNPDKPADGKVVIYKGGVYYPALLDGKPRKVEVVTEKANLRYRASPETNAVGVVKKGDILEVAYWCFGAKPDDKHNESVWWILGKDLDGKVVTDPIKNGARLWVEATNTRPE